MPLYIKGNVMKRSLILVITILVFLTGCVKTSQEDSDSLFLLFYVNDARVERAETALPMKLKMPLHTMDRLITGKKSSVTVQSGNDTLFKVLEESDTTILEMTQLGVTRMRVARGTVISKLSKGRSELDKYIIETPMAVIAVRGTEFSVTVSETEVAVAVTSGVVEITRTDESEAIMAERGESVTVTPSQMIKREITEKEQLIIEKVSHVDTIKDIHTVSADTLQQVAEKSRTADEKIDEKLNELESKQKANLVPQSLAEIRRKYGVVQEINLYNGKKIKGYILRRGEKYQIVIPGRIISINADDVENVNRI